MEELASIKVAESHAAFAQMLNAFIVSMEEKFQEHRDEEVRSRETYRGELKEDVTKTVKVVVNGKIDEIKKTLDNVATKVDTLTTDVNPLIIKQKDSAVIKKVVGNLSSDARAWAATVGSIILLGSALLWLIDKFGK